MGTKPGGVGVGRGQGEGGGAAATQATRSRSSASSPMRPVGSCPQGYLAALASSGAPVTEPGMDTESSDRVSEEGNRQLEVTCCK